MYMVTSRDLPRHVDGTLWMAVFRIPAGREPHLAGSGLLRALPRQLKTYAPYSPIITISNTTTHKAYGHTHADTITSLPRKRPRPSRPQGEPSGNSTTTTTTTPYSGGGGNPRISIDVVEQYRDFQTKMATQVRQQRDKYARLQACLSDLVALVAVLTAQGRLERMRLRGRCDELDAALRGATRAP